MAVGCRLFVLRGIGGRRGGDFGCFGRRGWSVFRALCGILRNMYFLKSLVEWGCWPYEPYAANVAFYGVFRENRFASKRRSDLG